MHITSLYLKNFRVYEEAFFTFDPHIHWILGANAKGKTSLLEALFFLTSGKSFRTKDLSDLIQKGKEGFTLELSFLKNDVPQKLTAKLEIQTKGAVKKGVKQFWHNDKKITGQELLGIFLGVSCHPDDIEIIKGSPSHRRGFLDTHISQYNPLFIHHLKKYEKALKEKNALLKQRSREGLSIFEETLARSGAYLIFERIRSLKELEEKSKEGYHRFCKKKELTFIYQSSFSLPTDLSLLSLYEAFLKGIAEVKEKERILCQSLVGPQRDSFSLLLEGKEMKAFSSEGEKRSLLLTLKKGEWLLLMEKHGVEPVLFIDDAGQNLDDERRETLKKRVQEFSQVFLTATECPSALEEGMRAIYL